MEVKLLYWGRSWGNISKPGKRGFEYHPYCQLEICESGHLQMLTANGTFVLHAGDMLLLPPGVGHNVFYPDGNNLFYSLKFDAGQTPEHPVFAASDQFSSWIINSLHCCHEKEARHAMPITSLNREIVEGVLTLLMKRFHTSVAEQQSGEPELFRRIRDEIRRTAKFINVETLAERLDMNAAQLNYQFSKILKEYDLPPETNSVKKLIDQGVLHQIDRYLDFTAFSLTEIARLMKFNNVYTFSRYYKRLTGITPSQRRERTDR